MSAELAREIDRLWDSPDEAVHGAAAVEEAVRMLDEGEARVAEPGPDGWVVNEWTKQAILLYFRLREMETIEAGPFEFHDKIPLKRDHEGRGVRVVPPGVARYGALPRAGRHPDAGLREHRRARRRGHDGRHVGDGRARARRSGATCTSRAASASAACSSRRRRSPVIVEDGAFIGSRAIVVEGVHVGEGAVLGAGVVLTASTPIVDVTRRASPSSIAGCVPPRARRHPGHAPEGVPRRRVRRAVRAHHRAAQRRAPTRRRA